MIIKSTAVFVTMPSTDTWQKLMCLEFRRSVQNKSGRLNCTSLLLTVRGWRQKKRFQNKKSLTLRISKGVRSTPGFFFLLMVQVPIEEKTHIKIKI